MDNTAPAPALREAQARFEELSSLLDGAQELLVRREEKGIGAALRLIAVAIRLSYESADDVEAAMKQRTEAAETA